MPEDSVLGANVSRARRALGLSVDQLGARAGVSKRALERIEAGADEPGLPVLNRVADALGVSIGALLLPHSVEMITITEGTSLGALWTGPAGGQAILLASVTVAAPVEIWRWTLEPGERYISQPHPTGVIETMTILGGEVVLTVADAERGLVEGLTATYAADLVHTYTSVGTHTAEVLMTVHLPVTPTGYRPLGAEAHSLAID